MKRATRFMSMLLTLCLLLGLIPCTALATTSTETESGEEESSGDVVSVHVTAKDAVTGKTVSVAGADVNLYVGADLISTTPSDSDGIAKVSLAGLTIEQRENASISANKIVARGKGIDGTARDDLFKNFPKENGKYYRYTLELHSETIDSNGNWLGAEIPEGKETGKVDIVFAIDATGSMSDEIDNVKDNIASFSENLSDSGLDIRFCIIEYRDITESEETLVHEIDGSHWITDIDTVVSELNSIVADGGGDGPETVLDPLGYMADDDLMKWRSDAYRFGFVLTDSNYKADNNYGYADLTEVAAKLAEMNVVTSVISVNNYNSLIYSKLSGPTGGITANIRSASFGEEMLKLSDNVIDTVVREMTLNLSEPRLLVNMAVCYFADDSTSQSASYKDSVKNMLSEYSHRLAETTDGHVMIDKILLFSTNNRQNFYDTTNRASMADIRIESEEKDDGKFLWNVKIGSNAHVYGFYSDMTYTAVYDNKDETEHFKNLKKEEGLALNGKDSFYRIQMGGTIGGGWNNSLIDDVHPYSSALTHETGHYLFGFLDEYLDANDTEWDPSKKPYSNYGLMDHHRKDLELSKASIDYAYMTNGFSGAATTEHTAHSYLYNCSCEDTLSNLISSPYYLKSILSGIPIVPDYELGDYVCTYTKAAADRTAGYPYAGLTEDDFLSPRSGGGRRLLSGKANASSAVYTVASLSDVVFVGDEDSVSITVSGDADTAYAVAMMKTGDESYADVALTDGSAELNIAKGEMAEIRVMATKGDATKYNTYFVDRSEDTDTGYLYTAADNAVMAYVLTEEESSYTFIADNTQYANGDYISVNQATRITSDNGAGFDSGEIYSVANYLAEIDYTTLSWFKYAGGVWTALDTDYSEEENMNIGARADLDGEGLYVLMAKPAPIGNVLAAENLTYTQSEDRDAVVTLSFDDPNADSKYYNVYYSENEFTDKNADDVVIRSFSADDTDLTINLLERGRRVYAAVEIVAEDGSRSELSEIVLVGGEADSDGDGIPDWYCDKYLLWGNAGEGKDIANSDDDGDGLTNLEEYRGNSDPTNPNDPVHTTNVPVTSVSVSTSSVTLGIGQTAKVAATVAPENATNKEVQWKSEDAAIASVEVVEGECVITAVAAGEVNVYAVTKDGGYSAAVKVVVSDLPQYTISASAGVGGTITPNGEVTVLGDEDQKFEIAANTGYKIKDVKVDGVSVGAVDSYTFTDIQANATIEAVFELDSASGDSGDTGGDVGGNTPGGDVGGSGGGATVTPEWKNPFIDVADDAYYAEAVKWAVQNGVTSGTTETTFSPDRTCTRANAVTFLWRAAGCPEPTTKEMPFSDVDSNAYYYKAVLWAMEQGITMGTTATTFGPNAECTRAQIVTFLWRAEKSPSVKGDNPFADVKSSAYYAESVLWAAKESITNGTTETTFAPNNECSRAQIVTFLWRKFYSE